MTNNYLGKNVYHITLEGRQGSTPVRSDSYTDAGKFFAFYNNIDGKHVTVAVFNINHVVSIVKTV